MPPLLAKAAPVKQEIAQAPTPQHPQNAQSTSQSKPQSKPPVLAQSSDQPKIVQPQATIPQVGNSLVGNSLVGNSLVGNSQVGNSQVGNSRVIAQVPSTPRPSGLPSFNVPSPTPSSASEPQVLVGEIAIKTPEGQPPLSPELEQKVYAAISTKAGRTATRSQLESDRNAILQTGFFSVVQPEVEDTDIGVSVKFFVVLNPILKSITAEGTQVLDKSVVDRIFGSQIGKTINSNDLKAGVKELEKYYLDNGYELAQVIDIKATAEGNINLIIAEGVIESIKVAFLNDENKPVDKDGKPVTGITRDFIITRELTMKEGEVYNKKTIDTDEIRVGSLGIFEGAVIRPSPGSGVGKAIITVYVKEKNTGSIAAGAGLSSSTGLFGTISFQQQNLGGNNQRLGLDIQVGERELLFDLNFTDPWLAGDPNRTSFTANIFNRRLFSYVLDSPVGVAGSNDTPRINRLGTGFSFSRPLGAGTSASLGFQYDRVSITDANNAIATLDSKGNPLSASGSGQDDLLLLQFAYASDQRDNRAKPSSGNVFTISTQQSSPVGLGSIFLNRVRASYSYFMPVKLLNFSEGIQALAFHLQAGTVIGTLPPYEAFQLGGSNSVRGWDEGKVGSGRSYGIFSAEYRFPVFNIVGGVLFFDYGTDLGSASGVPGNPAGARNKPGSGAGYGIGVRVQSPLGSIRVDYGLASNGGTQFSFGLGEKF